MREHHDADCNFYASINTKSDLLYGNGICNCGYGLQEIRRSGEYCMYSKERLEMVSKYLPPPMTEEEFEVFLDELVEKHSCKIL